MSRGSGVGRRALPPVYLLGAASVMGLLHRFLPGPRIVRWPFRLCGLPFLAAGLGLVLWSAGLFRRAGTTIRPFQESTALVVEGPYRFSRNPIYCGMVAGLIGIAVLLGSASPFAVIPLFVAVIGGRFIRAEEEALEKRFGDVYRDYARRVGRWL